MFSERLESLIKAALQDGKLTEQEKNAIVKRAQAEKENVDEVMIYIDSLLQKRQMELKEKKEAEYQELEKKEKEAIGPICPKCHKPIPPLALVCECGYEFKKERHESSVKQLYDKISNIQLTDAEIDSCSEVVKEKVNEEYRTVRDRFGNVVKKLDEDKANKLKLQKQIDIIQSFPVPNTKEDIMEFLALAVPNSKTKGGLWGTISGRIILLIIAIVVVFLLCVIFGPEGNRRDPSGSLIGLGLAMAIAIAGGITIFEADKGTLRHNKMANAWRAKFDQVLMKGRSLRADSEFNQMLDYYENQLKMR